MHWGSLWSSSHLVLDFGLGLGLYLICSLSCSLLSSFPPVCLLLDLLPPGLLCAVVGSALSLPGAGAMEPQTAAEINRARLRSLRPELPEGRPTLEATNKLRDKYWSVFLQWLSNEGIDFERLLEQHVFYVDEINIVLTRFGRALYRAGRPYNQYAETINSLTTRKPALRRQMQGSWDLAYSWVAAEPSCHHVAMPWQVLLAMVTTCLLWGWVPLAGILSLGFGSLLRAGELLSATRANLLLPQDVEETIHFCSLRQNIQVLDTKLQNLRCLI